MSFFTVGWQPPANIGLLPQHAGDGGDPFFAVGWVPKQSATYYPFSGAGMVVAPGVPDAPAAAGAPAAPQPPVPAPSPILRAHVARATLLKRKNPSLFRRHGLRFAIELQAPGVVSAVLVTSAGRRKLTYTQQRSLRAGVAHMTLRPGEYGRLTALRHKRTAARLEISIRYADGSRGTLVRSVLLARGR